MKTLRDLLCGSALVAGILFINGCQPQQDPAIGQSDAPLPGDARARAAALDNRYIVVLKEGALSSQQISDLEQLAAKMGINPVEIYQRYRLAIEGFAARLTPEQVALLRKSPLVDFIEADQIVKLDEPTKLGFTTQASTQQVPWGIRAVGGFVNYTGTAKAYILDTGIDLDNPDLNVDAAAGYNAFTSGADAASLDDLNSHGTHVSGTIAAKDNDFGVVGVAAGAKVVPVKVLGKDGSGSTSGIVAGIDFVGRTGKPGDVANMSLGGLGGSSAMENAVKKAASKGIYFSLAAGNSSLPASWFSPARLNATNVNTVSAHDSLSKFASFSNYGNPPVEVAAPGVAVRSTVPGGYATYSGTSMAAPHLAGIMLANGSGKYFTKGVVTGDRDKSPDKKASRVR
ncbi:hypothetical protein GCM10027299_43660 [Larkinella ripae]